MSKILIVDDSPTQTFLLVHLLTQQGYEVACESSGNAGLKRALEENFDLLILDLNLPDMSGLEIGSQYKAAGNTAPILLVTSEDQMDKVTAYQGTGPDFCCVKDKTAILRRVEYIFFRLRRRQSLSSSK